MCELLVLSPRFFFCSFTKVVATTKREREAVWGPVNMLYVSKTLAGGEQQLDVPEERIDTEGGFEYRKIFSLFKVVTPTQCPFCLYLKPKPASFLIFSLLYHTGRDVADSHPHNLEDFRTGHSFSPAFIRSNNGGYVYLPPADTSSVSEI